MNQSSPLPQPNRQRIDEQIATSIVEAVLDGTFPPGTALPPERELAEQLGVNRTSLRQALARLQHMGLVEARQGSGNVVHDPGTLTHPAMVEALVRRLGPTFLLELLEIRDVLGAYIGRAAAERGTPDAFRALHSALAAVEASDSITARQASDLAYFEVLIHATGNRALALMYRWVQAAFGEREHELTAAYEDAPALVQDLLAITQAVEARDPDAAATAVQIYTRASGTRMLKASQSA